MTLWGEPEEVHVQKMVRLHAHDCHQNVTEHSTTQVTQNVHILTC